MQKITLEGVEDIDYNISIKKSRQEWFGKCTNFGQSLNKVTIKLVLLSANITLYLYRYLLLMTVNIIQWIKKS